MFQSVLSQRLYVTQKYRNSTDNQIFIAENENPMNNVYPTLDTMRTETAWTKQAPE